VLNSVLAVFPQVSMTVVPEYFDSPFLIASETRLALDRDTLRQRFDALDLSASFSAEQIARLAGFFDQVKFERVPHGRIRDLGDQHFNHDLFPRDEYFLNNEW
jgi:hypothetical protein